MRYRVSEAIEVPTNSPRSPRRKVVIRRDNEDFVIAQEADGLVIFRNESATALRKMCGFLHWVVVSDVAVELNDPATW
jgi:hypothetical protein